MELSSALAVSISSAFTESRIVTQPVIVPATKREANSSISRDKTKPFCLFFPAEFVFFIFSRIYQPPSLGNIRLNSSKGVKKTSSRKIGKLLSTSGMVEVTNFLLMRFAPFSRWRMRSNSE